MEGSLEDPHPDHTKGGVMTHTCNPDILGVEAGKPEVQGHPWLQKLRASLGYWRDPVSNFQYRKGNQNCKKTFPLEKQSKTETGDSQKKKNTSYL